MKMHPKIAAVVLSGGAGHRFGGKDKGLIRYAGKTLIEHTLAVVSPQVDEVFLCVNRNLDQYRKLNCQLVLDQSQDRLGPLAGISAAIAEVQGPADSQKSRRASYDFILVATCDSPKLPKQYVNKLMTAIKGHDVAVVHDGERRQNLHCLIARPAWPSLSDFFAQGGRAMHRWLATVEVVDVDFSEQRERFWNLNSPAQLEQ